MEQTVEIAQRIAGLRDACGYTQAEFAKMIGIDSETYAGYEKNGDDIPISVLYKIAGLCGVDFTEILTGTAAKLTTYHIVKKGKGKPVDRFTGYSYEDLAFRYSHKVMQPLLVTLDPTNEPAELVSHSGQEFNYIVSGTVVVSFDGQEFALTEGDSIYFNPAYPHGQRCGGDTQAVFLTVITN
ncbi:MAG TPA: XRE family transcriptional regulator [Oscillospiraceae bacterium]|nr:XRE family transcriptional regulator [Oscillospiraceae bacterium]HPF55507.1 XRE family transcriptional regulator [Clostridiales bacterium]HPK34771.1 XRE family transcriptional regulator [Oscillospiraceae bacterium]HPR76129.1 XRE family transcriptional regulator [Oscillospiraceae bacterium]